MNSLITSPGRDHLPVMFLGPVGRDDEKLVDFPVGKFVVGLIVHLVGELVVFGSWNIHHLLVKLEVELLPVILHLCILFTFKRSLIKTQNIPFIIYTISSHSLSQPCIPAYISTSQQIYQIPNTYQDQVPSEHSLFLPSISSSPRPSPVAVAGCRWALCRSWDWGSREA